MRSLQRQLLHTKSFKQTHLVIKYAVYVLNGSDRNRSRNNEITFGTISQLHNQVYVDHLRLLIVQRRSKNIVYYWYGHI